MVLRSKSNEYEDALLLVYQIVCVYIYIKIFLENYSSADLDSKDEMNSIRLFIQTYRLQKSTNKSIKVLNVDDRIGLGWLGLDINKRKELSSVVRRNENGLN